MNKNLFKRQQGLNLIELMIAIVIGMFISLMVVQYLTTSSKLFRQQGADTNLEANGTFAISYLSQFIRQAGSSGPSMTDVPFFVEACENLDPCTADGANGSDRIGVQIFPQTDFGQNSVDCVGNLVPAGNRIVNVFSIQNGSLVCRGYDRTDRGWLGQAVELIDGIDQLQFLYGVAATEDGPVERYVDAARVAPPGATAEALEQAWDLVRAVKVAILVSDGANSGTEPSAPRTYQLLDAPAVTYDDKVSRKVYTTTVTIHNKLL